MEANQLALFELGGLELIVNLLETRESRCVRAALSVILQVSASIRIRVALCDMDVMLPLVRLLDDRNHDVKAQASQAIFQCAKNIKNRRAIRNYDGIRKLVKLLTSRNEDCVSGAAYALWSCTKSDKNKIEMEEANVIPILSELLLSDNPKVAVPIVGILQECASVQKYRQSIRQMGMIPHFLNHIKAGKSIALVTHSVSCIFQCASDAETRAMVREIGGLGIIAALLDKEIKTDIETDDKATVARDYYAAITGAIWKLCIDHQNVEILLKENVVKKLVEIISGPNTHEITLVRAIGALGAFAQTPSGRQAVREANGIKPIIQTLTSTDPDLLENAANALGSCAQDSESMISIDKYDGVRLLWSLLKSSYPAVQASSAWAISPCIEHAKDAGEMVRSFVGGLELMVSLLKSSDVEVLAGVCSALSKIARDQENLGVMTDHGIVAMLSKLTTTRNDRLKKPLAEAICQSCNWGKNRLQFGKSNAVGPLVKFLKSSDVEVHKYTALALQQLSVEPMNCVAMHENGAVPLLLDLVGSTDAKLQEAAAATVANIRKVALADLKK
eukprot:Partr_v1_DN27515_c0_g1_i2_m30116 putative Ubox domain-containing protein